MEPRRNLFGLSAQAKALLIEKLSSTARCDRRVSRAAPTRRMTTAPPAWTCQSWKGFEKSG